MSAMPSCCRRSANLRRSGIGLSSAQPWETCRLSYGPRNSRFGSQFQGRWSLVEPGRIFTQCQMHPSEPRELTTWGEAFEWVFVARDRLEHLLHAGTGVGTLVDVLAGGKIDGGQ